MKAPMRRVFELRAAAYASGVLAGEARAKAQADQARRALGDALIVLGDAIATGDKERVIACYAKCAEAFSGETGVDT
jgi:hypothetical protein